VHTPFARHVEGWPDSAEGRVERTVCLAEALGARTVVAHAPLRWEAAHIRLAFGGWQFERLLVLPWASRAGARYARWLLEELPALEARAGVCVAVENMPARRTCGRRLRLHRFTSVEELRQFRHLVLDTTHWGTCGVDPVSVYAALGERIIHVHLSNYDGREHRMPFKGELALERLLEAMRAARFAGLLVVEVEPGAVAEGDWGETHIARVLGEAARQCRSLLYGDPSHSHAALTQRGQATSLDRVDWAMRRMAALAIGLVVGLLTSACRGAGAARATFDGERAYGDVRAQVAAGPRLPGSRASVAMRAYFARELRQAGWSIEEQRFAFDGVELTNVVATRGEGPLVIVGAHYDSRARADRDPRQPNAPVPAANDGASGAAVLLELARALDPDRLEQQVRLAFFDGEDQGGIDGWPWSVGARHFAEHLDTQPEFVIVVDMVGDAQQELYWERTSTAWLNERLWSMAEEMGYSAHFVAAPKHSIIDDHTPFLERGIAAVDMIDFDYPYWHTTADTVDKVSAASLERVGRLLEGFLESPGQSPPVE